MNDPSARRENLAELLEEWRNEPSSAVPSVRASVHGVAGVARALRGVAERRRRSRRLVRGAAALAVAASVLGVVFGGWLIGTDGGDEQRAEVAAARVRLVVASGALSVTDAAGRAFSPGAPLVEGTLLSTADGSAELAFASGARAQISERADVRITEASAAGRETLQLSRGRLDVEVPHGGSPVVFSVKTPDALVVVHGTRFSVDVDPLSAAHQTSVSVTRGVVAVHAGGEEVRLRAGERWPAASSAREEPAQPDEEASSEVATPDMSTGVKPPSSRAKSGKRRAAEPRAASARLSEENELFAAAMAKKKAGDFAAALHEVESFLSRFPRSVLVQEARVERFRLLQRLGRTREAARHARDYLGDYREGYAREEARDIALESP